MSRTYRVRAAAAMVIIRVARWLHPEPLVVMESGESVTVVPDGYQINIPGTDIPLARITSGSVADQRESER